MIWSEMGVPRIAIIARAVSVALMVLSRALSGPYDTSASLQAPCLYSSGEVATHEPVFSGLSRFLEDAIVWDGVYYVRIAQCGYEYEQMHAFLPLLPLGIRLLAFTVFRRLIPLVGLRATLSVSGHAISNAAFVLAAWYFYRLSMHILQDEKLATRATVLFCFNPASVFYSSIYSESLFCLLSFAGLWQFVSGAKYKAVVLFGLSSAVRSNGVLHAGFFLYGAMHQALVGAKHKRSLLALLKLVLVTVFQTVCVIGPFVAFQAYGFYQICGSSNLSDLSTLRTWCKGRVPYLYGFVQSHYWNVGFLRYFQLKQVPNFLLASPMLLLAACSITSYSASEKRMFWTLGLAGIRSDALQSSNSCPHQGEETVPGPSDQRPGGVQRCRICVEKKHVAASNKRMGFFAPDVLCFLYQLAFMTTVATLIMHVQVATRFLSVSPPVYWYAAHRAKGCGRLVWGVFLGYFVVGTLLFANFYPFT